MNDGAAEADTRAPTAKDKRSVPTAGSSRPSMSTTPTRGPPARGRGLSATSAAITGHRGCPTSAGRSRYARRTESEHRGDRASTTRISTGRSPCSRQCWRDDEDLLALLFFA